MGKSTFTPEPWTIQDAGPNSGNCIRMEIVGENGFKICDIEDSAINVKSHSARKVIAAQKRDEANARLIAAAPDLLAACKRLVEGGACSCRERFVSDEDVEAGTICEWCQGNNAIAGVETP